MASLALDVALWGGLRDHIDLASLIFAKLPLDAFFRLRVVCKNWNRLASDRAFLLGHFSSLKQPYFIVNTDTAARNLQRGDTARLLQRGDGDAGWTWTRLPPVKCDSSGVLVEDSSPLKRFFDLHTRMVHALPVQEMQYEQVVGVIVEPHEAFRVVIGDECIGTRIYDSKSGSWTHKDSTQPHCMPGTRPGRTVSALCDEVLYVRTPSLFMLHRYNVRDDEWSVLVLPRYERGVGYEDDEWPGYEYDEWECCDFGVWKDRLFMVGLDSEHPRNITVWELLKEHDDWSVLDSMPDDLYLWMCFDEPEKPEPQWGVCYDMKSRFCGEYVLVYYSVLYLRVTIDRGVLYNLNSRKWVKVELPRPYA